MLYNELLQGAYCFLVTGLEWSSSSLFYYLSLLFMYTDLDKVIVLISIIVDHYHAVLRNEFNFWNVHGIMNTSALLQS